MLEKHFKTSAVDPRLQSPYIRTNPNAEKVIQQEQEKKGELELSKKRKKMFMSEPVDGDGKFLPLDFYLLENEYGEELMRKYSVEGRCFGYSKYYQNNGEFEWQRVQVVGYNYEQDKYEVEWEKNGKRKLVTRINLRFEEENEEDFARSLKIAEHYRHLSEVFIKYNYMIDQMEDLTSHLSEETLVRIQYFVCGMQFKPKRLRDTLEYYQMDPSIRYNFKRYLVPQLINFNGKSLAELFAEKKFKNVEDLIAEIKAHFVRTNHQITFDVSLPFSEEKQRLFRGYIPEEMFLSAYERQKMRKPVYFPNCGIGPINFIDLFEVMKKQLH